MAIKDRTFEKEVFKELDLVWKTYLNVGRGIKMIWVRRERMPKLIHIYWWQDFFEAVWKTLDSNPLMSIILDTIDKSDYRYYPIYSRKNKWYRKESNGDMFELNTYYDKVNHVWDYANNKVDFALDEVVWWYPPILTWLFVERPSNTKHWDLLIYFIKRRYASKTFDSTEASDWGTEGESNWSSEELGEDSMTIDSEPDVSDSTESDIE